MLAGSGGRASLLAKGCRQTGREFRIVLIRRYLEGHPGIKRQVPSLLAPDFPLVTFPEHFELVVAIGARSRFLRILLLLQRELQHRSHRFGSPAADDSFCGVGTRAWGRVLAILISKLPPKLKVGRRLHQLVKRLIVGTAPWLLTLLFGVGVVATRFSAERKLFAISHAQWFQVLQTVLAGTRCEILLLKFDIFQLAAHSVRVVIILLFSAHIVCAGALS